MSRGCIQAHLVVKECFRKLESESDGAHDLELELVVEIEKLENLRLVGIELRGRTILDNNHMR